MAYLKNNTNIEGKWLVFDLGGGTFDAAILEMDDKIMSISDEGKATSGDNNLGGKLFDRAIFDKIIAPRIKLKYKFAKQLADKTKKEALFAKLKREIEIWKKELSDLDELPFYNDDPIINDDGLYISISNSK